MPERVEAESEEARAFLKGLRDILGVPKAEVAAKLSRMEARRRRTKRDRKAKTKDSDKKDRT